MLFNLGNRKKEIEREEIFIPDEGFSEMEPDDDEPARKSRKEFLKGMLTGVLVAGILVLAGLLFRFGTVGGPETSGAKVLTQEQTLRKLSAVQQIIEEDYLWEVDPQQLEAFLFKGIAVGLDDPYSAYYTQEEEEMAARENQGSYTGIGVVFTQYEEEAQTGTEETADGSSSGESAAAGEGEEGRFRIVVSDVYEGSPAMEAGVAKGDVLAKIAGENVRGLSLAEVMMKIDQAFGDSESALFSFVRAGEEYEVQIREDEIMITQISGRILEKGTGYICIPEFTLAAPDRFREILSSLEEEAAGDGAKLQALILDVRDNPGGNLDSVTEMLDDLLDECVTLTSSNAGGEQERFKSKDGRIFDGRMAVLVNGGSASAAEVFAGALQYYKAALVVGQKTFGKGTVQHTYTLSDGSAFKLTSEKYAIAGEKEIDGEGVMPDLEVPEEEENAAGSDMAGSSGEKVDRVLAEAIDLLKCETEG